MAGITSVGAVGYQQYYIGNASVAGGATSLTPIVTNSNRQRANKDSVNLNEVAQELRDSLKPFSKDGVLTDLFANGTTSNSFQVMARDSLDKLVKAYNKFSEIIKSSKYVTSEGAKLLNQVKELMTGKNAADYRKMGLELNKQTGKINFDDKRFLLFLNNDIAKTGKLLVNDKYFTMVLQNVSQSVLGKQTGYYFNSPIDVSV